jgi:hypothetical protein
MEKEEGFELGPLSWRIARDRRARAPVSTGCTDLMIKLPRFQGVFQGCQVVVS